MNLLNRLGFLMDVTPNGVFNRNLININFSRRLERTCRAQIAMHGSVESIDPKEIML